VKKKRFFFSSKVYSCFVVDLSHDNTNNQTSMIFT